MSRRGWSAVRGMAMAAAAVALCPPAAARERLVRQLGSDLSTPPQYVRKLAQDATGHLWVGTDAGLYRYDGVELRKWAPETIDQVIWDIAVGDDGSVYAAARDQGIYRITDTGAEVVTGPDGGPWRDTRRIGVDAGNRLWVVTLGRRVFRQGAGAAWEEPLRALIGEERPLLAEADGDGVLVATNLSVWRVDGDGRPQRVVVFGFDPPDHVMDLLRLPGGGLLSCHFSGRVFEHRDGQLTLRLKARGNGWALARRGDTVWVVSTDGLAAWRPDGTVEHLHTTRPGEQRGQTVLVDREGSLWVGSARGAFQFPEPDTTAWSEEDGLGGPNMKLARTAEGLWISYWSYRLGLIERKPEGPQARMLEEPRASLPLCASRGGTLWGMARRPGSPDTRIMSRTGGAFRFHRIVQGPYDCNEAPDGGVWLTTGDAIFYVSADDQLADLGPAHDRGRLFLGENPLEDARGTLWLSDVGDSGPALCHAPTAEVRAGRRPSWTCLPVGDVKVIQALADTPSGAIWVATRQSGVLRYDGAKVETLPGSRDLPSGHVPVLEPAHAGGFWVSGSGYLWRVKERTDLPSGWSVEEQLGPANGIMADGSFDVSEDDDGTLWLTTSAGVVQVPPSARTPRPSEPRVRLQRVAVNGRVVDPSAPVVIEVPYGNNEVALDLSALLFRDSSPLRYRIRLGPDAPWSTPSRPSRIQLVDVPSGRYQVEVSATTDGATWTAPAAVLKFAVPRPWHRQPGVWALAALAVLAAAVSVQRALLAVRLRLERQRTQIALDLHDEMGSGLGSIRVLASMAARGAVDTEKLRLAAARIERTARDLGQAMGGIVWSLRDSRRTLRDLCAHVAERGHELFPEETPAFETELPSEWPPESLPLPLRRNLQLILMEALHNAAKHAQARRVVLGAALEAGRWRLWVEDDGTGVMIQGVPTGHTGGHGLPGMAERARNIGAELQVGRARGTVSGTRVEVLLPPTRFRSLRSAPRGLGETGGAWRTSRS